MTTTYRLEFKVMYSLSGRELKRGRWIVLCCRPTKVACQTFQAECLEGVKPSIVERMLPRYRIVGTRSPKPQALVAAHESDKQVSAPTALARLPVQRLLVSPFHVLRTLFGEPISRSLRPAFARLHPSWAPVSARWPLAVSGSQMPLPLGPTQTASPLLASDLQRQKRALRADLRAIRLGGNC